MTATFELVLAGTTDPRHFMAFVRAEDGATRLAEHVFEWRWDSTELALTLAALEDAALSGQPPENDVHIRFGRRLFDTVFGGAVGELWNQRRSSLSGSGSTSEAVLRLVLRPDTSTARRLLNLPWEYLHDSRQFIALDWRTPLSRLPLGPHVRPGPGQPPLEETLRMLVVISSPHGLGHNELLNTRLEEDLILSALSDARRAGFVQVEFAPNAAYEKLATYLEEVNPHILHFVGHGRFDRAQDTGYLLLEDRVGGMLEIPNKQFVNLLQQHAHALRFVFLSACQSAVNSRNEAYADLAPLLLQSGVPATVAMQFSVLNRSAMQFGSYLYKEVARGKPLDGAITVARGLLQRSGPNTVDFATPVLYATDQNCLHLDVDQRIGERDAIQRNSLQHQQQRQALFDSTGVARAQQFVGRNAELRELQSGLDPQHGSYRAAIVYGLGGMGKTVLAARLADRMLSRFDGIKSIRMTPTTTAQDILDQLSAFLLRLNARINNPSTSHLITELAALKGQPVPIETKASVLIDLLTTLRLFIIFDNYEDVLPGASLVSRAAGKAAAGTAGIITDTDVCTGSGTDTDGGRGTDNSHHGQDGSDESGSGSMVSMQAAPGVDPELSRLVSMLLEGVPGPSRFLFTSRADFQPLEQGRLTGAIAHLPLAEMPFRDAIYLMDTLPPLADLLIAEVSETKPTSQADQQQGTSPAQSHTKRSLYEKLGGHPYTLTLFAEHVSRASLDNVLRDLSGVRKELVEFTLLDRAAAALAADASRLLHRAAIYEEPVPIQGLAYMLTDTSNTPNTPGIIPDVQDEVRSLLSWGLLACPPVLQGEERVYTVPAVVRDWALKDATVEGLRELWALAANYWLAVADDSQDLGDYLGARHYLFLAGQYERADAIVNAAFTLLLRWGHIELLLSLLEESIRTTSGQAQAVAMGNKAIVYQGLGQYTQAKSMHLRVLTALQELGDRRGVAGTLHQLGMLHQHQGEYEQAKQMYTQSLSVAQELGDRRGVAGTLYQLGNLHYLQGEYEQAREMCTQSLSIAQELGDQNGVAITLHGLGNLHYLQGEYEQAKQMYMQSLSIAQELGDRSGVANTLQGLGNLHYLQGEYEQAREMYTQSLSIKQELGDRRGVASTLHGLGMLHQRQGEYEQAKQMYTQSLAIEQELGNRRGVAGILHQLGVLHQQQGEYEQAKQMYTQSLAIEQELGDRRGVASTLHGLGMLHQHQGEYEQAKQMYTQSFAIKQELGDRSGVASTLHQLGMLHQQQGEYKQAKQMYTRSLSIKQELGSRSGVAITLHQLGMLHQHQGEYEQAREMYTKSLAIAQELGDRRGVANTLGQLGLLNERQGRMQEAVRAAVQAFAIFDQLGVPQREQMRDHLARLREQMDEQAFDEAVQAVLEAEPSEEIDRTAPEENT